MSWTAILNRPSQERRSETTRRNLGAVLFDGAFFSLMVGSGETYFSAFALASHAGKIASGLLTSMPMLLGAILQLATPWAVRRLGAHRAWVVGSASLQAASLFLLPLSAWMGAYSVWGVFAAVTLYWAGGLATGPAWNTWIEELVPKCFRTHFFARRVRISQICTLLGFAAAGLWLECGEVTGYLRQAFTSLFFMAGACRFLSAACLASQTERTEPRLAETHVGLVELMGRLHGHTGARLLWYLLAVQVAVQTSGPYFSPYMLGELKFSYLEFMLLITFAFVGKVVALPAWARLAHHAGARKLLWIGGIAIIPVSGAWLGLWFIPYRFPYLAALQFAGGVAWAAYELAFFLMFFEAVPRRERTALLTLYNFGNAGALAVGSLLGAAWLGVMGTGNDSFLLLFGISSVMRFGALFFLWRIPETRTQEMIQPPTTVLALRVRIDDRVVRPTHATVLRVQSVNDLAETPVAKP